jgi:uncharacterized protein YkwD
MPNLKNGIAIGLTLLLCLALSGCGNSDTATSSTNNTQVPPPIGSDNQPPSASISAPRAFISGQTVTLDGSGSSDPDGDSLVFLWTQTQGPAILLSGTSNSSLSFVAPTVTQPTQFTFRLTVQDSEFSDSADFNLQISPLTDNTPPSVTVRFPGPDQSGVAVNAQISVTFNEALLASSVDGSSLTLTQGGIAVPGSVSYDENSHSISFSPDTPLVEGTTYSVNLGDSAQDLAGNPTSPENWVFTTASGYNLGATTQQTIDLCMDEGDKEMLTLVNNARSAPHECGGTSYPAAAALAWHCQLENAAQGHSTSMAENDYFSHTGLDGSSPGDRISAAGYNWSSYGENIAAGYGDAQTVMDAWMASAGHCANLMNDRFTEMGAGTASNPGSTYGIYWTQDFASPR